MNNSKVYYSVSLCQEHGFVLGKIRIRRTEDNKYYVIKKLTNVTCATDESEILTEYFDESLFE